MQKWLMPVACHMLTYTLKDSARIWWDSQKAGSILNYEDLKAKFRSHFSQQKKFTKTHLAVYNIKQEKESSWFKDKKLGRVSLRRPPIYLQGSNGKNLHMDRSKRRKARERFLPFQGTIIRTASSMSQKPNTRDIIATEKATAKSFEQPSRMFRNRRSRDMSKYCHFYEDHRHETNDCCQLRNQIKEAMKLGQFFHLVKGIKKESDESYMKNNALEGFTSEGREITFPSRGSNSSAPGEGMGRHPTPHLVFVGRISMGCLHEAACLRSLCFGHSPPNLLVHGECLEIWDYQLCAIWKNLGYSEWSTPAGLKLARENLQSRVKEEDSITDVKNAVFDLGVMDSLCFLFIDQRVFIGMITKFIKFIELNFSVITRGFDIKVCMLKGPDNDNLKCWEQQIPPKQSGLAILLSKTAPTAKSLASHMISKGKSQSGATKIGAWVNFILRVSKASMHSF
ncbi:hypothetical protein Tco_0647384 [Tanacetum coccineum]